MAHCLHLKIAEMPLHAAITALQPKLAILGSLGAFGCGALAWGKFTTCGQLKLMT
jgi:hypothetical protein